jgi:hypothetical protein
MTALPVTDDEIILRHIPGGISWQVPPDGRIASTNFRLRPGETGISVTRKSLTTPDDLLARLGDPTAGSRISYAQVGEVRALGFEVVSVPLDVDAGHAEIRSVTADLAKKSTHRALAQIFRYV